MTYSSLRDPKIDYIRSQRQLQGQDFISIIKARLESRNMKNKIYIDFLQQRQKGVTKLRSHHIWSPPSCLTSAPPPLVKFCDPLRIPPCNSNSVYCLIENDSSQTADIFILSSHMFRLPTSQRLVMQQNCSPMDLQMRHSKRAYEQASEHKIPLYPDTLLLQRWC